MEGRMLAGASEFRFSDLPDGILHRVLRDAGRHTREVCGHWHDAYGPLDCSIQLATFKSYTDVLDLASSQLTRFHKIAHLHMNVASRLRSALGSGSNLGAIPIAFANLRSLHLDRLCPKSCSDIASLAPLSGTLTSLTITALWDASTLAALPRVFQSLRSLDIETRLLYSEQMMDALKGLSTMQHLRSLSWKPDTKGNVELAASIVLQRLTSLHNLTHLDAGIVRLDSTDSMAPAILCKAFPQLRSLNIRLQFRQPEQAQAPAEVGQVQVVVSEPFQRLAASLAQRTVLTCLQIQAAADALVVPDLRFTSCLPSLKQLELHNCTILLESIGCPPNLTTLFCDNVELVPGGFASKATSTAELLPCPTGIVNLRLGCSISSYEALVQLRCLTNLQRLKLTVSIPPTDVEAAAAGAAAIGCLQQLTALHVTGFEPQFLRCLMAQLPQLSNLQQLELQSLGHSLPWAGLAAAPPTALTQLVLNCRSPLTLLDIAELPMFHELRNLQCLKLPAMWDSQQQLRDAESDEPLKLQLLRKSLLPLPAALVVLSLSKGACLPALLQGELMVRAAMQGCRLLLE